jgi:hypothetical protein
MTFDIRTADTRTLLGVVNALYQPSTWLLDKFFPSAVQFEDQYIHFDKIVEGRKLAPFVHPDVKASRQQSGATQVSSIEAPYIKLDEAVKPGRALKRRAGEPLGGDLTPEERFNAIALDILDGQRKKILRTKEWMAAQMLVNGKVTLTGEGYAEPIVLDFNRDATLDVALTGGDRWGEAGVSVLDDLEDWAINVQDACGVAPNEVVMDLSAWRKARKDTAFLEALDNRRGGGNAQIELGPISPDDVSHARYVGTSGDFDFYVYQQTYKTETGTVAKFLPENTVLMGSAALEGVQAHAAIQSVDTFQPLEMAARTYEERNPDRLIAETQSAPVVFPMNVNGSMRATVG